MDPLAAKFLGAGPRVYRAWGGAAIGVANHFSASSLAGAFAQPVRRRRARPRPCISAFALAGKRSASSRC